MVGMERMLMRKAYVVLGDLLGPWRRSPCFNLVLFRVDSTVFVFFHKMVENMSPILGTVIGDGPEVAEKIL